MTKKNFEYSDSELAEIAMENQDFKSPAFQFYVNDILGSNRVLMLSTDSFSAYMYLLLAEWNEKDCGLPTTVDKLVKLSRIDGRKFVECKEEVLQFFFEYKGRLFNRRLLEERVKQIKKREINKENIKKRYQNPTKDLPKGLPPKGALEKEKETEDVIETNSFKEGGMGGDEPKTKMQDRIKADPSQLFTRYFPRQGTEGEIIKAKRHIETYGVQKVIYAFSEANNQGKFSMAYIDKILENLKGKVLPREAKANAEKQERESAESKAAEKKEIKVLEEKSKKEHEVWVKDLWTKYKSLEQSKVNKGKLDPILKKLQEKNYLGADLEIQKLLDKPEKNNATGSTAGFTSIADSVKVYTI